MKLRIVAVLLGSALIWPLGQAGRAQAEELQVGVTPLAAALPRTLLTDGDIDAILQQLEAAAAAVPPLDAAKDGQPATRQADPAPGVETEDPPPGHRVALRPSGARR
jgi:hypothetical protein